LNHVPKIGTIVPKMSTSAAHTLSEILFGRTKSAVLAVLYGHEGKPYYLRQLLDATGAAGIGAVQRQVTQLLEAGLITKSTSGNRTFYRANPASPVFKEIKSLVSKTISAAKLRVTAKTDSDPVTVSDAGFDEAAQRLREQEIILDLIGETMGRRRLGAEATRSQLIFSAIRNFIEDCREEEDLREAIDQARMRINTRER
jgi:hypothetical protein